MKTIHPNIQKRVHIKMIVCLMLSCLLSFLIGTYSTSTSREEKKIPHFSIKLNPQHSLLTLQAQKIGALGDQNFIDKNSNVRVIDSNGKILTDFGIFHEFHFNENESKHYVVVEIPNKDLLNINNIDFTQAFLILPSTYNKKNAIKKRGLYEINF